MAKAADITRILSCTITRGENDVIALDEANHKSVLLALMNLLTSSVANTDSLESAATVKEFVSDVKRVDLAGYEFFLTDLVKEVSFMGADLQLLIKAWASESVGIVWLVDRGGKRASTKTPATKLGALS